MLIAMQELGNQDRREMGGWRNNLAENSHLPLRRGERAMLRFRQMKAISVGGLIADPNMAAYCAMKHAVVGLTKAGAVEYARKNIRVNAIAPGFVVTPMTQHWADSEAFTAMFYEQNISGRAALPEEIAGTVLHLCSDDASFVNGAVWTIDGGQTAH